MANDSEENSGFYALYHNKNTVDALYIGEVSDRQCPHGRKKSLGVADFGISQHELCEIYHRIYIFYRRLISVI